MIISMRPHATKQEVEHVCERIREFGFRVHSIEGEERVVIGVVGVGGDVRPASNRSKPPPASKEPCASPRLTSSSARNSARNAP